MSNFNFYDFLHEQGYQKQEFATEDEGVVQTNYQKELSENIWNSLTVHKDKTITGASPKSGIVFKQIPQPTTIEDANLLLNQIEDV